MSKRGVVIVVTIVVMAALLVFAPATRAQDTQGRTVTGTVTDANDQPVEGALVYLRNTKTGAVKTSYAEKDGAFRFYGLAPTVDYELHAEHGGKKSDTKTVSSFDSRKSLRINLRIK